MYEMPAVIFAGGKSSRMGQDKALLPFGGYNSLTRFQYNKLSALFSKVYLLAKEEKFDFDAPFIKDLYEESSPLIGIISIFKCLDVEEVFVLSVDAPFIDKKIIHTILKEREAQSDAIIAQSPNGLEPLCGLYRRSILPLAESQLAHGNHRLHTLLKSAKTKTVTFKEVKPFTNINHPHEYQEALLQYLHT